MTKPTEKQIDTAIMTAQIELLVEQNTKMFSCLKALKQLFATGDLSDPQNITGAQQLIALAMEGHAPEAFEPSRRKPTTPKHS